MFFSVSNDGIERSLEFGPDSDTLTVKTPVQELTINSQGLSLEAWSLLFSQRQDFLNIQLARIAIATDQEGTMEMTEEVLSSVGAQDMDTSGYHVSHQDDVECYCDIDQLDVDAVFRPDIDTLFPRTLLTFLRWVQWLKTRFWLTMSQTRRTLPLFQQLQSPGNQHNLLFIWEVAPLEYELRMLPFLLKESFSNIFHCYVVSIFIYTINMFLVLS